MTNSTFNYKHVLIILPERLGDTIFHTPSIALLKKMRPDTVIDILALSPLPADVVANNPFINAVFITPTPQEIKHIANHYDVILNVHNHGPSREYIEQLARPTLTELPPDPSIHQSEQALNFVKALLNCDIQDSDKRYNLHPDQRNFKKVDALLSENNVMPNDILIGCHIGCHSVAKRGWKFWKPLTHKKVWPLQNFILLDAALRQYSQRFRLVLTGSKTEKLLGNKLKKSVPSAIDLIDKTSVTDLAALMQRLHLFLTPDTGALHVACASDVGLVALFGPTLSERTGPYPLQKNHVILRAETMSDISVAEVARTIVMHPDIAKRLRTTQ